MTTKSDPLYEGPEHYRQGGIQPIEFIMSQGMEFLEGNIVKYISRWRHKNGIEDLHKARHYLEFLIRKAEQDVGKDAKDV